MPTWPSSVPFKAAANSYESSRQPAVIRTEMDAGPVKTRRRYTAVPVNISFTMLPITRVQFDELEAFFIHDLQEGALPFTAAHPRSGLEKSFRFRGPYRERASGHLVIVSLELEELP